MKSELHVNFKNSSVQKKKEAAMPPLQGSV
jgi:hypothetical protein